MGYSIIPSADRKYIILTVKGEINRISAMKQNAEAHALGRKMGINKYLVDVREARNTDNVKESYDFANTDMQKTKGIDKYAKVAVLVRPGDHSHDFVETVARNAGLNVKIFTHIEMARQYLQIKNS